MTARGKWLLFFSQAGLVVFFLISSIPCAGPGVALASRLPGGAGIETISYGSKFVPGTDLLLAANGEEGEVGADFQDMGAGEGDAGEYVIAPGDEQQYEEQNYQEGEPEYMPEDAPVYEGEYVEGGEEYPAEDEQGVIGEEYQQEGEETGEYYEGDAGVEVQAEQESHEVYQEGQAEEVVIEIPAENQEMPVEVQ